MGMLGCGGVFKWGVRFEVCVMGFEGVQKQQLRRRFIASLYLEIAASFVI